MVGNSVAENEWLQRRCGQLTHLHHGESARVHLLRLCASKQDPAFKVGSKRMFGLLESDIGCLHHYRNLRVSRCFPEQEWVVQL